MSAEIASSSPLLELPPEIWLKIFRIATFIPRETDVSATTFEPGLFCSYDEFQALAFEVILPFRRTIVLVSRRFYQIGAEVLYTTFHANANRLRNPGRRLLLFSNLLVSRPELGRFVKRLSLWWLVGNEERNYRIISRCPNVMIFTSSNHRGTIGHLPWWGQVLLPKTIRSFDAVVDGVPMRDILTLLEKLPHLEMLSLWGVQGDSISYAPVCLSALRILSINLSIGGNAESCLPVLSTMQLPRLTALETNAGVLDPHLSFPLDVWRQVEHFKLNFFSHTAHVKLRSNYFHKLRHLYLTIGLEGTGLEPYLMYFPFRQLECLTLRAPRLHLGVRDPWQQRLKPVMNGYPVAYITITAIFSVMTQAETNSSNILKL